MKMVTVFEALEHLRKAGLQMSNGQLSRMCLRNNIEANKNGKFVLLDLEKVLTAANIEHSQKIIPVGWCKLSDLSRELGMDRTTLRDFCKYYDLPYRVIRGRSESSSGRVAIVEEASTRLMLKEAPIRGHFSATNRAGKLYKQLRSSLTIATLEMNRPRCANEKKFIEDLKSMFGISDLGPLFRVISKLKDASRSSDRPGNEAR